MVCFHQNFQSDLTDETQIVHISARMHLTDVLIFCYSWVISVAFELTENVKQAIFLEIAQKYMQWILGHHIIQERQTPDTATPPSVCAARLPSPPLTSSTFDANYTICPPSISRDRTMPASSSP